jgi:predicted fused transcriptional regulator/phosphomethylpyrimidine kinase/predicted transcriptional regulator
MVDAFLPSIRQLVARDLEREGFSQSKIASMLGITQASVSLYLSSSTEKAYFLLSSLSVGREESDRYASLLTEDVKRSPSYAVATLGSVWANLLGHGAICKAHRRLYPSLAECDYCLREFGGRSLERSEAVAHVAEAVRVVESAPGFVSVMPEVSVNIAYLPVESEDASDVIAVPGRIVKVRGSAKAMLPPEFGASGHMARILLLVRKRLPEVRAVINLRYDAKVDRVVRRMGLRRLTIGGYAQASLGDSTGDALVAALSREGGKFDVLVDTGGSGIEPNVYLFGRDAVEVARLAKRLARLHSGT